MCRFIAYHGDPTLLADPIASPGHSPIRQAIRATESRSEINGDGFGGYREIYPARSSEPIDERREDWFAAPANTVLIAHHGDMATPLDFNPVLAA